MKSVWKKNKPFSDCDKKAAENSAAFFCLLLRPAVEAIDSSSRGDVSASLNMTYRQSPVMPTAMEASLSRAVEMFRLHST
jgi:hypothetical protein